MSRGEWKRTNRNTVELIPKGSEEEAIVKSVLILCAGLVLGAAVFWSIQHFGAREPEPIVRPVLSGSTGTELFPSNSSPDEKTAPSLSSPAAAPQASDRLASANPPPPAVAGAPIFNDEEPDLPKGGLLRRGIGEATGASKARSDLARIVDIKALEKERQLTRATFDVGERDVGKKLMERFYAMWKDEDGLDLTPEVGRLLQVENQFTRRREYFAYLAKRGESGALFQEQLRRGVKKLTGSETDKATAYAAWEEMTLAYELARNREERAQVLAHLNPFLKRMVFSGRSPLLLTSYTVKSGDNLSTIAARFKTTVGSIRRINGLSSDVIQPRQHLRILSGKVRIFVHKSDFRLWGSIDDRFLLEMPVGLGLDSATPLGSFVINVKEKNPTWWRPGEAPIPHGDPKNILGSRWLGFADTDQFSGFGIHGTEDPSSVGKESSAGCVRLNRADVELLYDFVPYRVEVVVRS